MRFLLSKIMEIPIYISVVGNLKQSTFRSFFKDLHLVYMWHVKYLCIIDDKRIIPRRSGNRGIARTSLTKHYDDFDAKYSLTSQLLLTDIFVMKNAKYDYELYVMLLSKNRFSCFQTTMIWKDFD